MSDDPKRRGKLNKAKINKLDYKQAQEFFDKLGEVGRPESSVISQKVSIATDKIDNAISFWKKVYFSATSEGRLLNGAEAYELGDDKLTNQPDKGPYIAMCNLLALEALKIMGDNWPTVEDPQDMVFGSDREKAVASFWKDTFAPTLFQTQWAWTAVMSVMAGEPHATADILDNYENQL